MVSQGTVNSDGALSWRLSGVAIGSNVRQKAFRFEHIIASSLAVFIAGRYSVIRCAKVIGISSS